MATFRDQILIGPVQPTRPWDLLLLLWRGAVGPWEQNLLHRLDILGHFLSQGVAGIGMEGRGVPTVDSSQVMMKIVPAADGFLR